MQTEAGLGTKPYIHITTTWKRQLHFKERVFLFKLVPQQPEMGNAPTLQRSEFNSQYSLHHRRILKVGKRALLSTSNC